MILDPVMLFLVLLALLPRRATAPMFLALHRLRYAILALGAAGLALAPLLGRFAFAPPFILGNLYLTVELLGLFGRARRSWIRWLSLLSLAAACSFQFIYLYPHTGGAAAAFWFVDYFDRFFLAVVWPLLDTLGLAPAAGDVLGYLAEPVRHLSSALLGFQLLVNLLVARLAYQLVGSRTEGLPPAPRLLAHRLPLWSWFIPAATFGALTWWPDAPPEVGWAWKASAAVVVARGLGVAWVLAFPWRAARAVFWAGVVVLFLHPQLLTGAAALAALDSLFGLSEWAAAHPARGLLVTRRLERLMDAAIRAARPAAIATLAVTIGLTQWVGASWTSRTEDAGPRAAPHRRAPTAGPDEPTVPITPPDGPAFQIDRFEHPNVRGELPHTGLTPAEADRACRAAGKHVCTAEEWFQACSDGGRHTYPLPARRGEGALGAWRRLVRACNLGPLRPDSRLEPSGSRAGCRGPTGAADTAGNAFEWVRLAPGPGAFARAGSEAGFWGLAGSYYGYEDLQSPSCAYAMIVHEAQLPILDLAVVGFRCCATP